MDILKGIRPLDYVLTAVMVALAALIGFENVNAGADADVAHALDSHSALMIPVFVVAALPILWRRRNILAAIGVSFVVDRRQRPDVRLGHPLRVRAAAVVRDGVRRGAVRRQPGRTTSSVSVGILALQVVTLVKDSSTDGLGALAFSVPVAAALLRHRARSCRIPLREAGPPRLLLDVEHVHA